MTTAAAEGVGGPAGHVTGAHVATTVGTKERGAMRDCASPTDWERHEGASGLDLQLGAEEETWVVQRFALSKGGEVCVKTTF